MKELWTRRDAPYSYDSKMRSRVEASPCEAREKHEEGGGTEAKNPAGCFIRIRSRIWGCFQLSGKWEGRWDPVIRPESENKTRL